MLRIHLISLAYARQLPLKGEAFKYSSNLYCLPLEGKGDRRTAVDEVEKSSTNCNLLIDLNNEK